MVIGGIELPSYCIAIVGYVMIDKGNMGIRADNPGLDFLVTTAQREQQGGVRRSPLSSGAKGMSEETPQREPFEKVIELRLPSKLGYERVAMDTASSLARRMGFAPERVDSLKTAVSEAVTNAIEHGNQHDAAMKVVVMLTAREDELIVSVADQGRKPLDQACTTGTPTIEEAFQRDDKGGWGIWLIRELMDEVEFSTGPSGGNQVRMVIHLEQ